MLWGIKGFILIIICGCWLGVHSPCSCSWTHRSQAQCNLRQSSNIVEFLARVMCTGQIDDPESECTSASSCTKNITTFKCATIPLVDFWSQMQIMSLAYNLLCIWFNNLMCPFSFLLCCGSQCELIVDIHFFIVDSGLGWRPSWGHFIYECKCIPVSKRVPSYFHTIPVYWYPGCNIICSKRVECILYMFVLGAHGLGFWFTLMRTFTIATIVFEITLSQIWRICVFHKKIIKHALPLSINISTEACFPLIVWLTLYTPYFKTI